MQLYEKALDLFEDDQSTSVSSYNCLFERDYFERAYLGVFSVL